jgi:2-polyprenyl-3-methyl-5-hydroxy-6-metoxy-1,4-benzoquinol methylase
MGNQAEQGFLSPFLQRVRIAAARPYLSGRVLDFGCGNGALAAFVAPECYLGIDRDQDALAAARASFPQHKFQETVPVHGPFDTIVGLAVIEHLKNPQQALVDWCQLLSESGCLLLTTPHPSFRLLHEIGARVKLFSRDAAEEHQDMLDHKSLTTLASEAGLRIEHYARFLVGANQLFVLVPNST